MLFNYYYQFIWFCAALTPAISIAYPGGYNIGPVLLLLSFIPAFFIKKNVLEVNKVDKLLILVFVLYFVAMLVSTILDNWQWSRIDKPSRYVLAIPILLILLRGQNYKEWLWYGIVAGSILALPVALHDRFVLGISRAQGAELSIMFGNTGLLLGFISIAAACYFYSQKRYFWLALSVLSIFSGMAISLLSGTRGGWIAAPLILLFLLWQCRDLLGKKRALAIFTIGLVCVLAVVSIPKLGVQQRVLQAVHNIESYINGNENTSVGLRFEMWKGVYYMTEQAPIFGVGYSQFNTVKKALADEGKISQHAVGFSHSHNEFLDALAKRGVFGLFFLLLIFIVPLKLFLSKMRQYSTNWKIKSYAIAGVLVPMSYIDFNMTQVMFAHAIGGIMYIFLIIYFWAAVRWAEREELAKASD